MPPFLTPQWIAALDRAARAVEPPPDLDPHRRLVLGQEVYGTPHGDVRYQLVVDRDGLRVQEPPDGVADLTFVCDYATAVALARGETNAQDALVGGGLRLRGDVERFSAAREAIVAIGDAFADVRADTEF